MNKHSEDNGRAVVAQATKLLDAQEYSSALKIVEQGLLLKLDASIPIEGVSLLKMAGLLIDIGSEGRMEGPICSGLKLLEHEYEKLQGYVPEASLQYNMGNAKSALFGIRKAQEGFALTPASCELLTEAKNHYWKAMKVLRPIEMPLKPQLYVNLANALSSSGRIAEALQFFDQALVEYPEFPYAAHNRAEALLSLHLISNALTATMLRQVVSGFAVAASAVSLPGLIRKVAHRKREWYREKLNSFGYAEVNHDKDLALTKAEHSALSRYRKYCLANYLTLSEHSLYCPCNGSRNDNLTIPLVNRSVNGKIIPKMEHLLNRLKSEFVFARQMYYRATLAGKECQQFDDEVQFTELGENEAIGAGCEMMRTSFRLCFGILDKIARGVCEIYDLAEPDEKIYFERFWHSNPKRWEKINSIDNFPLLALYSQATDLSSKTGEWHMYKKWRNSLEHGMFIVSKNAKIKVNKHPLYSDGFPAEVVSQQEFEAHALQLLRFVRSAIFNFVFCVRSKTIMPDGEGGAAIVLRPKSV